MLPATIKVLLLVYLVGEECLSYQYGSKTDYITSKWKSKYQSGASFWHMNANRATTERPHHIRHSGISSRYPKLDGVMSRLNYYTTTKKPWDSYRRTTSDDDGTLDDNYDDLDYNEEDIVDEEKLDNEDEEKNDADYREEDNGSLFEDDEWQAEEATEGPARASSLTEYKWRHYGTRTKVEESRRLQMQKQTSVVENAAEAAVNHYLRVQSVGKCRIPAPKVVSVQSEHPSPGKNYIPHCTILHRCTEDSGCCENPSTRCGPKNQTVVHLYFYTNVLGSPPRVEKLAFHNHTECECLDKTQSTSSFALKSNIPAESIRRCKCPGQYSPSYRLTTHCACDCSDGDQDCDRMKRGKEYFSLKDRLCIKSSQCGVPACEYGNYLTEVGRCPRKQEKLEAFASAHVN